MTINLRKVSSANIEQVLYFLDKNKQKIDSKKKGRLLIKIRK
jgi:hypothetical protein